MRKTTRYNLKTTFGSLVNNQCAIEAGKSFPWWAALIVFLLAVFVPIIPTMVSLGNAYGASYVDQVNYSFDKTFTSVLLDLHEDGYKFYIEKEVDDFNLKVTGNAYQTSLPLETYVNKVSNQYDLLCYVNPEATISEASTFFKELTTIQFKIGTTELKDPDLDLDDQKYYTPSLVLFFKTGIFINLYKANSVSPITNSYYGGDWRNTKTGVDLVENLLTVIVADKAMDIPSNIEFASTSYIAGVFKNIKGLMNDCYLNNKWSSFTYSVLIYEGVYAGLIIILGGLIWLLTRGKKNLNRYLKIWQCEKIVAWAGLAPAILSLILGFLLSNLSVMLFILFLGLRVMWLSTRQLGPNYN